ncbi:MAG: hypothetical protein RLZZ618_1801 [Pseudomonadota bacterium]|jgi:peptidoglycan/LPS O-acetylase OafA/YrhL
MSEPSASLAAGKQRNDFIQVMRFVAAALVLVTHTTFYYHERIDPSLAVWHSGEIGVPIFFAISGIVMVIASTMLLSNAAGAKEFMTRRLLRILPLYWLVTLAKVIIALAVPAVVNHNHFDVVHAIKSFLFIPAYNAAGEVRPIHGVGWTLLHEMFFYVVFAAVMLFKGQRVRTTSLFILALYGLGLLFPPTTAFMEVVTSPINLYFIIGMLIGHAMLQGGLRQPATQALISAFLVVVVAKWSAPVAMTWLRLDPIVLLLGCAMLALTSWKPPAVFDGPVALGDSSYALYLFHPLMAPPVLMLIHKILPGAGALVAVGLTVAITVGLAHGVHRLVELPLNRWARKLVRRPPPAVQAVGEAA